MQRCINTRVHIYLYLSLPELKPTKKRIVLNGFGGATTSVCSSSVQSETFAKSARQTCSRPNHKFEFDETNQNKREKRLNSFSFKRMLGM